MGIVGIVGVINGVIYIFPFTGGLCTDGTDEQARNQLAAAQEEAKAAQQQKKAAKHEGNPPQQIGAGEEAVI